MRSALIILVSVVIGAAGYFGFRAVTQQEPVTPVAEAPTPARDAPVPESPKPAETAETQEKPDPPSFDVVRVSREGTGVIAGRAVPDSDVTILANDVPIGTATANRNGEWVLIFQEPLEPGSRTLSLEAKTRDGRTAASEDMVVVSVPERGEERFSPKPDNGVVAVLTPKDGQGASQVLQKPGQTNGPLEDLLTIDTLDYDGEGRAVMTGRAEPGSEVRIYLDNRFLAAVAVSDQGEWKYAPEAPIAPGEHTLRLDQVLEGGDVQVRIEQPFRREEPLNTRLAEGQVKIQPGNNLWHIARRVYGSGILYTLIFRENEDQIRDPDLIFPEQIFTLPRADGADGPEMTD